jgi:hypothetical protein
MGRHNATPESIARRKRYQALAEARPVIQIPDMGGFLTKTDLKSTLTGMFASDYEIPDEVSMLQLDL